VIVLIVLRDVALSTLTESLTGAAALDPTAISISRIMMFSISYALLNEVAEFLKEVQLHAIGRNLIAARSIL